MFSRPVHLPARGPFRRDGYVRPPLAGLPLPPPLEATGLLTAAREVYGRLKDGFYGLTATLWPGECAGRRAGRSGGLSCGAALGRARTTAGTHLLANKAIHLTSRARTELAAGKVDSRLLMSLSVMAAVHPSRSCPSDIPRRERAPEFCCPRSICPVRVGQRA
jgi:hypothetical protein